MSSVSHKKVRKFLHDFNCATRRKGRASKEGRCNKRRTSSRKSSCVTLEERKEIDTHILPMKRTLEYFIEATCHPVHSRSVQIYHNVITITTDRKDMQLSRADVIKTDNVLLPPDEGTPKKRKRTNSYQRATDTENDSDDSLVSTFSSKSMSDREDNMEDRDEHVYYGDGGKEERIALRKENNMLQMYNATGTLNYITIWGWTTNKFLSTMVFPCVTGIYADDFTNVVTFIETFRLREWKCVFLRLVNHNDWKTDKHHGPSSCCELDAKKYGHRTFVYLGNMNDCIVVVNEFDAIPTSGLDITQRMSKLHCNLRECTSNTGRTSSIPRMVEITCRDGPSLMSNRETVSEKSVSPCVLSITYVIRVDELVSYIQQVYRNSALDVDKDYTPNDAQFCFDKYLNEHNKIHIM